MRIGDKVRVLSELPQETTELYITTSMRRLEGKVVTIAAEYSDGLYDIEEDGGQNYWEEDLFEEA